MVPPLDFQGKAVIITGSGSGLGATYAHGFASRGAHVIVNDVPPEIPGAITPADQLVATIADRGGSAIASLHDVSAETGAAALIHDARDAFGRVDALISNAGVLRDGDIGQLSVEDWSAALRVNLDAHYLLTAAVWPLLCAQGGGRLVYTSSGSGLFGNVGQVNYSTAKCGVMGLARSVALEGKRFGIRANAFAPLAATPMSKPGASRPSSRVPARVILGPERFDTLRPEDVATLVMVLAHDQCPASGGTFTTAGGRVREVLIGETAGWGSADASAEELLANWPAVGRRDDLSFPRSLRDELTDLAERLDGARLP